MDFFQVKQGEGMVEGDDLDQVLAKRAIEEDVGLGAGDANVLTGQVEGFVVLDLQVVIVDTIDGEIELRWLGLVTFGCAVREGCDWFTLDVLLNNSLQAFGCGLNCTFIDVAANPAPTEFLGYSGGCARANKAIK